MRRRAVQLGLALAIAAMPAHAQTPDCGGWNTLAFFEIATGADVERCLAQGYGADARGEGGFTPLYRAVLGDRIAAIEALIDGGAQVDARNADGSTPLHTAMLMTYPAAIEALLDAGADPKARNAAGHAALDYIDSNPALKKTDAYRRLNELRFD